MAALLTSCQMPAKYFSNEGSPAYFPKHTSHRYTITTGFKTMAMSVSGG